MHLPRVTRLLAFSALLGGATGTANAALNLAAGKPEIAESGSWQTNPGTANDATPFGGQNITNGGDSTPASLGTSNPGYVAVNEFTSGDGTFWLPVQDTLGFININLGASSPIGEIDLYNARNGQYHDRATGTFHIDASNAVDANGNLVGATTILSGTLTRDGIDPNNGPNGILPDVFNAGGSSLGTFQYLSFIVDTAAAGTYTGGNINSPGSPGLNEIRVYAAVPEPATWLLLAVGLMTLVAAKRKR